MTADHAIKSEHMEAMKALAETNMRLSEAKSDLFSLRSEESRYLEERRSAEKKAVSDALDESRGMLAEIQEIRESARDLARESLILSDKARESVAEFNRMRSELIESERVRGEEIIRMLSEVREERNSLANESAMIDARRKEIQSMEKGISDERRRIDSERGALERAVKRIKDKKQP